MALQVVTLALLASLGLAQNRFGMDVLLTKDRQWPGVWADNVPSTGTQCTIYVKNRGTRTRALNGVPQVHEGQSDATRSVKWFDWGSQRLYTNRNTRVWTSCGDGLLVDWFVVQPSFGASRTWGQNDHRGWCLSSRQHGSATYFTSMSGWNPVIGTCYTHLRLHANGNVYGRISGRRELEAMQDVPTLQDVVDCEANEDSDCSDLVDEILEFEMEHEDEDMYELAVRSPLQAAADDSEDGSSSGDNDDDEDAENASSEESVSRRIRRLLRNFL